MQHYTRTALWAGSIGLIALLSSCDPGYGILISNASNSDKTVRVSYDEAGNSSLGRYDSLPCYPYPDKGPVSYTSCFDQDTEAHAFSFIIKAGYTVVAEHGTGGLSGDRLFVIAGKDTLRLRNDADFKYAKKALSQTWIHTIR